MTRPLSVFLVLWLAAPAAAQEAPDRFDAARPIPFTLAAELGARTAAVPAALEAAMSGVATAAIADAPTEPEEEERQARSVLSTVLHTLGGAVVGGWLGYVGSQVTLSDWEKETNSSFSGERMAWVAGGVAVGILGSRLIGRTSSPRAPDLEVQRPRGGRNVLTRQQIEESGAVDAYELVYTQRKEWLVPRGTNSFQETARGSGGGMGATAQLNTVPGKPQVVVYLDDMRLGEMERMREIPIHDIMEIRFLEPQEATYRFGGGHSHGVILLKTVP